MRRRTRAAAGLVGAGAVWCLPAPACHVPPLAGLLRIPRRIDRGDAVAVTFDDGPHPQGTPAVLEILAAAGATATFFVVGEQVRRHAGLVSEIAAAGHQVALHGDTHRPHLRIPPREQAADLERGHAAIAEATGREPTAHRPPYGIYSAASLRMVKRGPWAPLLWSRWGHDWSTKRTPAAVAGEVTEDLGAGDVLLLHDADHYADAGSWLTTVAALPAVLERIEACGLRTVTVS